MSEIEKAAIALVTRLREMWWADQHDDMETQELLNRLNEVVGDLAPPQATRPND